MRQYSDREQWFISRIGMRIFRNNYCSCEVCKDVYENGIVNHDENHAIYCYDMEAEYTMDGRPLRYFDTRDEMLEFEKSLK